MKDKIIHTLCTNIHNGRFNSEKYYTPQAYYGTVICVTPLHCSYGQIGYTVSFPYTSLPEVKYDFELKKLTVDGVDWREYFTNKINQLATLLGYASGRHTVSACTGKWAGTLDHYVEFDNGKKLFICNGALYFNEKIQDFIDTIKNLKDNYDILLGMLKKQAEHDAATAKTENLLSYTPHAIKLVHNNIWLDIVVNLTVDNCTFDFVETSLQYAIKEGPKKLEEHISRHNQNEIFTAGGIYEPTFVIMNVRHSHKTNLYKK